MLSGTFAVLNPSVRKLETALDALYAKLTIEKLQTKVMALLPDFLPFVLRDQK